MKAIYKYAIVILAGLLVAVSCGKKSDDPVVDPEKKEEVKPVSLSLSFVLPSNSVSGKTTWVAGDQIVVHGEYAAQQVTVTLEAGDIAGDGKSASKTVDSLYLYARKDCQSTLYASWPVDAVSNLKHCFFYSGFNNTNTPLMAACNDSENKFQFQDVSSAISFSVTGDYDAYALTGRKDAVVGYEFFQVKITDNEVNYNQHRENPLVTISGKLVSGGVQTIYLPGEITLPGGYELKLFKDGSAVKAYTVKTEVEIARGQTLDLGDITSKLKDYEQAIDVTQAVNLVEDDNTANCYIVSAPGVYKIPCVKGNTNESVGVVETASVLWETWNNVEAVTPKSLITSAMYEGGYVYFQVAEPFHAGNALIAAKDENEVILWSWHIWMPKTPVTEISEANYATIPALSRNVGALVDAPASGVAPVESFGLMYQWGRKDPFPGIGDPATNTPATVAGKEITYINDQVSLAGAVEQPTTFYYLDDNDWQNEGLDVVSALWGEAKKTVNDPCPPGYALPARNNSCPFWAGSDISASSYVVLTPENYTIKVGELVFPLAGYIDDADGVHKAAGECMHVWSGRWDSGTQNGYGFFGTVGDVFRRRGIIRSRAGGARCIAL